MISFLLKIILTACCSNYLITENSNNIDVSSSLIISEATNLSSKESFAAELITGDSSEINLDSGNLFSVDDKKFQTDKPNGVDSSLCK